MSGRILLVEDDEASRDMLSRRLARKGYAVKVVHDGAQALAAFGDATFDLVIMDMNLPVLDGYQATRRLRERPELASLPVIGLSAHAMPGSTEKAMEAGCDAYRTKPVQFESLCELIDELMTRARAGDADPIQ